MSDGYEGAAKFYGLFGKKGDFKSARYVPGDEWLVVVAKRRV
jgi:hypothetical protein